MTRKTAVRTGDPRAIRITRKVARALAKQGAKAVVLVGSYVRGDPHRESDIDLIVIGRGPYYRLERNAEYLLSISWRTVTQLRQVMSTPADAVGTVLGWRRAVILHDPTGVAKTLRLKASRWTWERVSRKCNPWVTEQITGYAEDVQKLIGGMRQKRPLVAAAYRCVLGTRLTEIMAVHHRLLYDGDHELFEKVGAVMGERWRRVQAVALGIEGATFEQSCQAAMELYAIAASEIPHLLDDRQYAVVAHACEAAGYRLPPASEAPPGTDRLSNWD